MPCTLPLPLAKGTYGSTLFALYKMTMTIKLSRLPLWETYIVSTTSLPLTKIYQCRSLMATGSAILTVVAASGIDANAGIPGVFSVSRRPLQRVERVQELYLANKMPKLWSVLSNSSWSTRGWTYQERKLSRRLLVFSDYQAYFNCEHATYREDQYLETEGLEEERLKWHQENRAHQILVRGHTNFWTYSRELEQYTKRSIS